MVTNISIFESIFLVVLCIVSFILPIIVLILGYMIYNKLDRIEEMMKGKG